MSEFKQTERESQSLLIAEALWLVQKRLRMGKVDWRAQVLIPILYMLSNNLTISLTSSTSPKAMILCFSWYLKPDSSRIIWGMIGTWGFLSDCWGFLCVSRK